MQNAEAEAAEFYFALPRLLAKLRGGSGLRSQRNWLEANVVGAAMHLIAYLFTAHLLLASFKFWQQVLLFIPLAFIVLISWMLILYGSSVVVRLLRRLGFFRSLPNERAQSVLVGIMITAMAWWLMSAEHWTRIGGLIWIIAVACNLIAAALLGLIDRGVSE